LTHPSTSIVRCARTASSVRNEQGLDAFDAGASAAFAVADHQVAHIYVNDRARLDEVREVLERSRVKSEGRHHRKN